MPVAQLSVLKYQLKPHTGLNATKNAVTGRPSRSSRISANGRERRASRRRKLKPNRASSHRRISQSATGFIRAALAPHLSAGTMPDVQPVLSRDAKPGALEA